MTHLNVADDCLDKAKVWAELRDSYGGQREWTQNDFIFNAPDLRKFDGTRPPYKVAMQTTSIPDNSLRGTKAQPGEDWRKVEITAVVVSTGAPSAAVYVGMVKNT